MKILTNQDLVDRLRKISDKVTHRLWIAVPYIGGVTTIRRILGKAWFENPGVSVRLITDVAEASNVATETIDLFHQRGEVKSLSGLHAKIYIIDDICLLTSANLTNTAFRKRYEVGIILTGNQAQRVVNVFDNLWKTSENIKPETFAEIVSENHDSNEDSNSGNLLDTLWELPTDPGDFLSNPSKRFLNYDRILADYKDFSEKYSSVQRLWAGKPLYLEIDGLFNFLYHHAPGVPSKEFSTGEPRKLSEKQQLAEIKKWGNEYRKWNLTRRIDRGEDDINWRIRNSKFLKKQLAPSNINSIKKSDVYEILNRLNCMNAYPFNKTNIVKNNSLSDIKRGINELVNGKEPLAVRMNNCNKIKNLGSSSMNELLGFTYPNKYPLVNKNSNSGLRFFGYQLKAYS